MRRGHPSLSGCPEARDDEEEAFVAEGIPIRMGCPVAPRTALSGLTPPRLSGQRVRRTASGVCHGTLGELYQGPLGHGPEPDIALVSFPVDRHSWVHFTRGTDPPGPLPLGEKSATAVRLFLDRFGMELPAGRWSAHSDLPVGVGMASSTADIVATLRCLFHIYALPYDPGVVTGVLSSIERADSVFLDQFALYSSARHHVVRRLGTAIGFHTAYVIERGTVDTAAVTPLLLRHYRRRAQEYERCLTGLLKGFSAADPAAVARAATASATLSQEVLPKRAFEAVVAHREEFGADGVFVAHTGSLVGYLFSHRPAPGAKDELSAFFSSLGHQCSFAQGGYG